MALRTQLQKKIQSVGRLTYGELCEYVAEEGFKVSYAERELRHLMEAGIIHKEESISKRGTTYISAYVSKLPVKKQSTVSIEMRDGKPVAVIT